MNKRRGYYTIEVAGKEIAGHFSVNFWALMEEELGLKSLGETFIQLGQSAGLSSVRRLLYCSSKAYCLEEKIKPYYNDIFECGLAMEEVSDDDLAKVLEAFMESKLMSNDDNFGIERKSEAEDDDPEGKSKSH